LTGTGPALKLKPARGGDHGLALARTHARTHAPPATVFVGLLATTGCAPADKPPPEVIGGTVSAVEAATLPFSCAGTLVKGSPAHYENLETAVTPYFCVKSAGIATHLIDAAGSERSADDLRLAEHAAFRDKYHRLARDLRERIAQIGETTPLTADVWFATRQADDEKVPPKPDLLAMAAADRDAVLAAHDLAIADRANEVVSTIQSLWPGIEIRQDSPAFTGGGPVLQVVAAAPALRAVGDLDGVIDVGLTLLAKDDVPASEVWYDVDQFGWPVVFGIDGDGVKVEDILGSAGVYDSTYLGLPTGSCDPPNGANYQCFCPAAAPLAGDPSGAVNPCAAGHMQHVLSVIKNTWGTLRGGAARHSTPLAGNGSALCANSTFSGMVQWGIASGVNVVNRSGTTPLSASRYLDYVATAAPFPTIVAASGNGPDANPGTVASLLRNGPVVGAANDHGSTSRTGLAMATFSKWQNYTPYWELPHLVAPGVNIDTVSNFPAAGVRGCDGTSFATPQVSGVVASLMERYPNLKSWPEAVLPILLVSSFTSAAPAGPDGTSFALDNGVDDKDGAGALDALDAATVANYKVDLGNSASAYGYDYGSSSSSSWPAGTFLGNSLFRAQVANGAWLRVAAVMLNHPSCGLPPNESNCTSDHYPHYVLWVMDANGNYYWSASYDNNYQYLLVHNTSPSQTYSIYLYMSDWQGLYYDTWSVAWSTY
jgi:Subtilase family